MPQLGTQYPSQHQYTYTAKPQLAPSGYQPWPQNTLNISPNFASSTTELIHEAGTPYIDPGVQAQDDVDGDLSTHVIIGGDTVDPNRPGIYKITYDVVDSAGNKAQQLVRTVVVRDTSKPTIALLGPDIVEIEAGSPFIDPGVKALDNLDGDLTNKVQILGEPVNIHRPGRYTVTYIVTDASGNRADPVARMVHIKDTTAPRITLVGSGISKGTSPSRNIYSSPSINPQNQYFVQPKSPYNLLPVVPGQATNSLSPARTIPEILPVEDKEPEVEVTIPAPVAPPPPVAPVDPQLVPEQEPFTPSKVEVKADQPIPAPAPPTAPFMVAPPPATPEPVPASPFSTPVVTPEPTPTPSAPASASRATLLPPAPTPPEEEPVASPFAPATKSPFAPATPAPASPFAPATSPFEPATPATPEPAPAPTASPFAPATPSTPAPSPAPTPSPFSPATPASNSTPPSATAPSPFTPATNPFAPAAPKPTTTSNPFAPTTPTIPSTAINRSADDGPALIIPTATPGSSSQPAKPSILPTVAEPQE